MKSLSYSVGLENLVHQCWRITPNWKCHLKCNFCYVPQLRKARKDKYNEYPEWSLDPKDYQNLLRKMLEFYAKKGKRISIPLSFCASDPPRDIELQIELLNISKEEFMRVYDVSEEEAERECISTTIILDIHDEGARERCLELMDEIRKNWKYGFVWIASTLWILDRELRDNEIQRHFEMHEEAKKRGFAFFSIITPSATKDSTKYSYIDYIDVAKKHLR